MSQVPPTNEVENLKAVQHDLQEVYQDVTTRLEEIYPLPKKFIEQTAPAVDKYLKEFSKPSTGNDNYFVFQAIMGFMQQFDDFALMTNKIFTDYKVSADNYKEHEQRIIQLLQENTEDMVNESAKSYQELTPELIELSNRLKSVKERSEEMVKRLERIETRWNKIKSRIKQ